MINLDHIQKFVKYPDDQFITQEYIDNLPANPWLANLDKSVFKNKTADVLSMPYIQPNKSNNQKWLVLDIDTQTSQDDWILSRAPTPNFIITNPKNGHSHLLWALANPIILGKNALKEPIQYLKDTLDKLKAELKSDLHYTGLIAKNPLFIGWETIIAYPRLYNLQQINEYLLKKKKKYKKDKQLTLFTSRNCELFDIARQFCYANARKTSFKANPPLLFRACLNFITQKNIELYYTPLPSRELYYITSSCVKWTLKNLSEAGFKAWSKNTQVLSLIVRQKKAKQRHQAIVALKKQNPDFSNRKIALLLKISEKTVRIALANPLKYDAPTIIKTATYPEL